MIAANAGAIGTLNIGAGAGNPAAAPGTLTAPSVAFGAGTGTLNFNHTSTDYVFAPAISGNGTVNVLAGTTTLTGANSYSGRDEINAGRLRAGAPNTFSPNSAVTIASGRTLDLNGFSQTVLSVASAGLVNMGTGTAPGTALTTTSYAGTGGTIGINTFLGSDGSPSDRLVIDGGAAAGRTAIIVRDTGGGGALTTGDGILVVDAGNGGTTAPGAFAGFAAAGRIITFSSVAVRHPAAKTTGSCAAIFSRYHRNHPCRSWAWPQPRATRISGAAFSPGGFTICGDAGVGPIYGRQIIGTLHERMGGDAQLLGPGRQDILD